jgi:hypothetical protein
VQMTEFSTCATIAALMITAPARACTDWQAVAKFDEMITKHHELLWSSSNCNAWKLRALCWVLRRLRAGQLSRLARPQ